ncbi:hypothetical protein E2986_10244 [Frieseomelitta varia]|uniref:Odorant receptor n=1 Tax=Frieseomelitta varia TaxID=561572 RepID=A0A833RE54_9HYME|nr:hypothetical protein E2986_10244 [Frieseomelitta varia]
MALKTIITYPIEVCLRLIGLWPNSSYRILQRIFWTIVMGTCVTFQIWYCITYFKTVDLPDLLDGLSVTLSNTITFIKLIILWFNYRKLRNILLVVFEDWNNCALTDQNKEFMTDNLVTCSRISKFLVVIYSMTCILYSASTMLLSDDIGELNSNNKKLLLKMRFPFDVMIFPLYEFITIAQFAFEYSVAFMAGMLMALSAALVLHIGSQIDIVCQELIDVSNHCEDEVSYLLKRVIIKHQRILYSLDTEQGPTIVAKCFPYYVAVICEAFVLCYTGEYLTSKSENINRAAYAMFWYNLNQQNSRTVLLILMGTQSPFTLTAGKFVTLCVETFANMLKVSASYISILLAMY